MKSRLIDLDEQIDWLNSVVRRIGNISASNGARGADVQVFHCEREKFEQASILIEQGENYVLPLYEMN